MFPRFVWPTAAAMAGASFLWYTNNSIDSGPSRSPVQLLAKKKQLFDVVMSGNVGSTVSRLKMIQLEHSDQVVKGQRPPGTLLFENKYINKDFKNLDQVVEKFVEDANAAVKACGMEVQRPSAACLSVAGVVTSNQCRLAMFILRVSVGVWRFQCREMIVIQSRFRPPLWSRF